MQQGGTELPSQVLRWSLDFQRRGHSAGLFTDVRAASSRPWSQDVLGPLRDSLDGISV